MKISENGLNLIKEFEGYSDKAYLCPAKIPTIGYGNTLYRDGSKVKMGDTVTSDEAENLLLDIVKGFEDGVNSRVKVPVNQNQFDALVSFSYNLGLGNLGSSTLLKKLNSGDYEGASNEFLKWNKSGGKELAGLTRRRKAERDLFIA